MDGMELGPRPQQRLDPWWSVVFFISSLTSAMIIAGIRHFQP